MLRRLRKVVLFTVVVNLVGAFPVIIPQASVSTLSHFGCGPVPFKCFFEQQGLPLRSSTSLRQSVQDDSKEVKSYETLYQTYIQQPNNQLKELLKERKLPMIGGKRDLAKRLVENDLQKQTQQQEGKLQVWNPVGNDTSVSSVKQFAGLTLSPAASRALGKAQFNEPSSIQLAAIPRQCRGETFIMHAETGSGKTLAYLLPITEKMWEEEKNRHISSSDDDPHYDVILTPTRELAAQVAGIATVLAPPGSVQFVPYPMDLMPEEQNDRGPVGSRGVLENTRLETKPTLFVGSARAIMHSLYADKKMPNPPTSKPRARQFLTNVRCLVLDEVDRLLEIKHLRIKSGIRHDKPASVIMSAVSRLSYGKVQIVAASATVGRPLRREMSRILGLTMHEAPPVVRGGEVEAFVDSQETDTNSTGHVQRAVTIPGTVQHYIVPVAASSPGQLLTRAIYVLRNIGKSYSRILLVFTKNCDIRIRQALGAMKHFRCRPEPVSLLDMLDAQGTDQLIQKHRVVTGATGVGESTVVDTSPLTSASGRAFAGKGYVLVVGEDSVRGLHLDNLDVVMVVGRADGPDEYSHIAGRTGRAGRTGKVINVMSHKQAATVDIWEKMLRIKFQELDPNNLREMY